jgi:hypothetical protein
MTLTFHRAWPLALAGAGLLSALPAQAVSNTSAAADWRLLPGQGFNGVASPLDSVGRLWGTDSAGQSFVCSGTLLAGGRHVLTAAHCADGFSSLQVDFGVVGGVASASRTVSADNVFLHSGWNGTLSTGADLAVLELSAPVTTIAGAQLSGQSALGSSFLFAGHGSTTTGGSASGGSWAEWGYAHWGTNTFDLTNQEFRGSAAAPYGETWLFDFDAPTGSRAARGPTVRGRPSLVAHRLLAPETEPMPESAFVPRSEALLAPGDSGAGAFVWDGSQWRLSAVMSWTLQHRCTTDGLACDISTSNASSFGDLAAATALVGHTDWIDSIINNRAGPLSAAGGAAGLVAVVGVVPEPSSYALFGGGLLMLAWFSRRRLSTRPLR